MISKLKTYINARALSDLLESRILLYSTFLASMVSMVYFTMVNDVHCISLFVLIAFLTTFFHKNMIVVLLTALLFSHIVHFSEELSVEGFTEKDNDNENENEKEDPEPTAPVKSKTKTKAKTKTETEDTESFNNKKQKAYEELKGEYVDFKDVQKELMDNVNEIHPLIEKADKFLEKLNTYKEKYKNKE